MNEGRLTLKKPYLEFLGNPKTVETTFGSGKSILIHNPDRRLKFMAQMMPPEGTALTRDEAAIRRLLGSGRREAPVDDQGRMRIEQVYLEWAELEGKTQAYLMPDEDRGWIEVLNKERFFAALENANGLVEDAFDSIALKLRKDE